VTTRSHAFLTVVFAISWATPLIERENRADQSTALGGAFADSACRIEWSDPMAVAPRLGFPYVIGRGPAGDGPRVYGWLSISGEDMIAGDEGWHEVLVARPGRALHPPTDRGLVPDLSRGPDGTVLAVWAAPEDGAFPRFPAYRHVPGRLLARAWTGDGWGPEEEIFSSERLGRSALSRSDIGWTADGRAWTIVTEVPQGSTEWLIATRSPDGSWTTDVLPRELQGSYSRFVSRADGSLGRIFVRAELAGPEGDANSLHFALEGNADSVAAPAYVTILRGGDRPIVDPSILEAQDGTLHVVAGRGEMGTFATTAVHTLSRDGGRSWAPETVLVPFGEGSVRRPILLEDPRGGVHAFVGLLSGRRDTPSRHFHFRWRNGGWEGPEPTFGDLPWPSDAYLANGTDGTVAAVWIGLPPDVEGVEPGSEGWNQHWMTLFAEGRWICDG
jgi:hypothetical protein